MQHIRITDMLATMQLRGDDHQPIPFTITFVTCDQKKNTGGEKITLAEAILVGSGTSNSVAKNPNHYANYTRNIRSLNSDHILKIHPLLVTKFNAQNLVRAYQGRIIRQLALGN